MDFTTTDAVLKVELETNLARAGVAVPADRMEAVFAGYKDLRRMAALLRQPRTAAAEPSNTYSLVPFVRGA